MIITHQVTRLANERTWKIWAKFFKMSNRNVASFIKENGYETQQTSKGKQRLLSVFETILFFCSINYVLRLWIKYNQRPLRWKFSILFIFYCIFSSAENLETLKLQILLGNAFMRFCLFCSVCPVPLTSKSLD